MIDAIVTLVLLIMLQAVLGFDNLLYISLESKRAPAPKQAYVRKLGIGLAVGFRIVLLLILVALIDAVKEPFFDFHLGEATDKTFHNTEKPISSTFDIELNFHALITLLGGAFILYTAIKEIFHMIGHEDLSAGMQKKPQSVKKTVALIVTMNVIFSFDSILSAMALAKDKTTGEPNVVLMVIAIMVGGALMIWLADSVSTFLEKNRIYEVLGLFILFTVGVMLVTEGGHLAHMSIGGNEITAMTKTTFYFVVFCLILTDIVQTKYQKKILAARRGTPHTDEDHPVS